MKLRSWTSPVQRIAAEAREHRMREGVEELRAKLRTLERTVAKIEPSRIAAYFRTRQREDQPANPASEQPESV